MTAPQSIPELVALAQKTAQDSSDDRAAIEAVAIDIFATFEARMQHHFKRGPFSRKLKALLVEAGESELADRVYQYYLAINVLKHGKGASHRELLKVKNAIVAVKPEANEEGESLIDVSASGFFDGLSAAILEAHDFLQNEA